MQQMPELGVFGVQVTLVVVAGRDLDGHPLLDFESVAFQSDDLFGFLCVENIGDANARVYGIGLEFVGQEVVS